MAGTKADKLNLAVSNHAAIKQALIDMGQNPTDAMSLWADLIRAIAGNGGGGGTFEVSIVSPSNIRYEDNKVKWDAVDISAFSAYICSLKYYVQLNGGPINETGNTYYPLTGIAEGDVFIQVYAILTITTSGQSETASQTIVYVYEGYYLTLTNMPVAQAYIGSGVENHVVLSQQWGIGSNVIDFDMGNGGAQSTLTSLTNGTAYKGSAGVLGQVAFAGGVYNSNNYATVEVYDTLNGGLKYSLENLSTVRRNLIGFTYGNFVVFVGGDNSKKVDLYDIQNGGIHSTLPDMSIERRSPGGAGIFDKIIIGGGYANTYSTAVEMYDMGAGGVLTSLVALNNSTEGVRCSPSGNYAIFSGGNTTSSTYFSASVTTYDISQGGLKGTLPNMANARGGQAQVSLQNRVFMFGGQTGTSSCSATVDVYDTTTKLKTTASNLATARYFMGFGVSNNIAVIAGGYTGSAYSALTEAYNLSKI
jgi:hypothetical protein